MAKFDRMKQARGAKVSVPFGMESRAVATIISGPHLYTAAELAENIKVNEECGYSTKRMCRSYYKAKCGRHKMTIATSHIREA